MEQESAIARNKLNSILLANASHEVRTPLNAIINYLELALDGDLTPEVRANLTSSHAASRSLSVVVADLLDLTRTERGQDLFLQDPFVLADTIDDAIFVHKQEAERRGLTLDVIESPSGTPLTLLGDRAKIKQLIASTVQNAIQHTKKGGILVEWGELADADVEDSADKKQDGIRIGISISDTGSGISEDRLESIFREFEQVSTSGDEKQNGEEPTAAVGLGLAVCARIIRLVLRFRLARPVQADPSFLAGTSEDSSESSLERRRGPVAPSSPLVRFLLLRFLSRSFTHLLVGSQSFPFDFPRKMTIAHASALSTRATDRAPAPPVPSAPSDPLVVRVRPRPPPPAPSFAATAGDPSPRPARPRRVPSTRSSLASQRRSWDLARMVQLISEFLLGSLLGHRPRDRKGRQQEGRLAHSLQYLGDEAVSASPAAAAATATSRSKGRACLSERLRSTPSSPKAQMVKARSAVYEARWAPCDQGRAGSSKTAVAARSPSRGTRRLNGALCKGLAHRALLISRASQRSRA